MAHRILGLDAGRRLLKLAVVDKTLRQTILSGWDEEPVPPDASDEVRTAALRRLMDRNLRPDDVLAVSMPTDAVLHRVLSFPFRDDKSIQEALGFELENHIPVAVADLCVDYTRLGDKDGLTEVLAIAAPRTAVESELARLRAAGVEPRRLGLTALAYASLARRLPDVGTGWTLLADIGTRSTDVVLLADGKTQVLRSVSVGADAVAALFAAQFKSDKRPEEVLVDHAWLLPGGATAETSDERKLDTATRDALEPLVRELRQTMAFAMRRTHTRPERLVVTGGLCKLAGLDEYLERALGLPVHGVRLDELPDQKLAAAGALGDRGALAVALALAAADPAAADDDVDFRQGELAYEGDFKVLRARLPLLALFAVLAVLLLGVRTTLTWKGLASEQDAQVAHLEALSKALIGKASSDFDLVQKELAREPSIDVASLYPDISAFKVLEELSQIIDKVTEPPDATEPPPTPVGGPTEPQPPQAAPLSTPPPQAAPLNTLPPRLAQLDPALRGGAMIRPALGQPPPTPMPPQIAPPPTPPADSDAAEPAPAVPEAPTDRAFRPPGHHPSPFGANRPPVSFGAAADRHAEPGVSDEAKGADKKHKDGEKEAGDDDADGAGDKSDKPFTGHKIELSALQIERTGVTLRGEADTQDALLALQQAVDSHRCFGKVKSSSDRITFERHRDWFKFTLQFEVACPQVEEKKPKAKAGAKSADGAVEGEAGKKAGKGKKDEAEEEP